jgi:TM2 domain-containing membrane protein YozV
MHDVNWLYCLNNSQKISDKNWKTTYMLSVFLGPIGADRFYLGSIILGFLKLITIGGFGIWWLADIVLIAFQKMKDSEKRIVKKSTGSTCPAP